jgi:hypothetical protein
MDFSWTKEQQAFRADVVDFARTELNDDLAARDQRGEFSRALWNRCAQYGIQGMSVPAAYKNGHDIDFMTAMFAMEGMGYGCRDNGLTFALNAQMWTVQLPILHFGSEEQKQRYLPAMASGRLIGAHAMTEPNSGSDAFSMQMTAQRQDDGYLLNGTKCFISLAPVADMALVFATIDPALDKWGISAFLVDRNTPGFSTSPVRE